MVPAVSPRVSRAAIRAVRAPTRKPVRTRARPRARVHGPHDVGADVVELRVLGLPRLAVEVDLRIALLPRRELGIFAWPTGGSGLIGRAPDNELVRKYPRTSSPAFLLFPVLNSSLSSSVVWMFSFMEHLIDIALPIGLRPMTELRIWPSTVSPTQWIESPRANMSFGSISALLPRIR